MSGRRALLLAVALLTLAAGDTWAQTGPEITSNPQKEWTRDVAFLQLHGASGGAPPYTWSITKGQLPSGLELSSTGLVSGVPDTANTWSFTLQVKDADGRTALLGHSMEINLPVKITTSTISVWTEGRSVTRTISATGGTGDLTWSLVSGSLPSGISLKTDTGKLTGKPEKAGSYTFTLRAADTIGSGADRTFTWTIAKDPSLGELSTKRWTVLRPLEATIGVEGGTPPYDWDFIGKTSTKLPPGVKFSASGATARVHGTPTSTGTWEFEIEVEDDAGVEDRDKFTLTIVKWPKVTTAAVPGATVGTPWSAKLDVSGGTAPWSFRHVAGKLPPGLGISDDGTISGTPGAAGTFTFTAAVEDGAGAFASREFDLAVSPRVAIRPVADLPDWTADADFETVRIEADGGTGNVTFAATGLPAGLSLGPDGVLAGRPAETGDFSIAVEATDEAGGRDEVSLSLHVNPALELSPSELGDRPRERPVEERFDAVGGTPPFRFEIVSGALPPGVTGSAEARAWTLSGTGAEAGVWTFAVRCTDAAGAVQTAEASLRIREAPLFEDVVIRWTEEKYLLRNLRCVPGQGASAWTVSQGAAPAGMYLYGDGSAARFLGRPEEPGEHLFSVDCRDEMGLIQRWNFRFTVNPTITALAEPVLLAVDRPATIEVPAEGGTAPLTWQVLYGKIPPGLVLDSLSGRLAGEPVRAGRYPLDVVVQDSCNTKAAVPLVLEVAAPVVEGANEQIRLAASDPRRHRYLEVTEGATVDVSVRFRGEGVARPEVSFVRADGGVVPFAGRARTKKRGFRLKKWVAPRTERLFLRIDNEDSGWEGDLKLRVRVKPPNRFRTAGRSDGPSDPRILEIPVSAGSRLKLKFRADAGVEPTLLVLESPIGEIVDLAGEGRLRSRGRVFKVKALTLGRGGTWKLRMALGVAGSFAAKVKVKHGRPWVFPLPE